MAGRPTKRTPELEGKLEYAFALGSTVSCACFYAGIAESTYFAWAEKDAEFSERMKALKERPVLKALETVYEDISNPNTAKWLLEKKHRDFKPKQEVEHSGQMSLRQIADDASIDDAARAYEENIKSLRGD